MKYLILVCLLLLISSCEKRDAQKFCNYLDSAEHRIYVFMISDSTERKRLQALNDDKPQLAKKITLDQVRDLDKVIKDIRQYNVENIDSAEIIKASTLSYYLAYREYKLLDTVDAYLLKQRLADIATVDQSIIFLHNRLTKVDNIGKLDHLRNKLLKRFKNLHNIK